MQSLQASDPRSLGRFKLVGRLGAGGMGQVYLGESGSQQAAIKVMLSHLAGDAQALSRFQREIVLMKRVNSRFTAKVLDADSNGNPPWLATEYIDGLSLFETINQYGPLPEASLRVLLVSLCEALEAIHGANLVHRDLKPSNLILSPDGPKVIDFGIAYASDLTGLTSKNRFFSAGYTAPEYLDGEIVTPAADIFSLGAIMTFAATGHPAFPGNKITAVMAAIHHDQPDLSGVPASLESLIRRCVAQDPSRRPTLDEIRRLLGGNAGPQAQGTSWLPATMSTAIKATRKEVRPVLAPTKRGSASQKATPAQSTGEARSSFPMRLVGTLLCISLAIGAVKYHSEIWTYLKNKAPHSETAATVAKKIPKSVNISYSCVPDLTEPGCHMVYVKDASNQAQFKLTGLTGNTYKDLCAFGYQDEWLDNHGPLLSPVGEEHTACVTDVPIGEEDKPELYSHEFEIKPPGWKVTWRLKDPNGKIVLSTTLAVSVIDKSS